MKLKKPVILSIVAVIIVWSGLIYAASNVVEFLREAGKIHYSFNQVERFHSKNIEHYEKVVDYMTDNILYFDQPFVNPKTEKAYVVGDIKQWRTVLERRNGGYYARLYDAEKTKAAIPLWKEVDLNELSASLTKSLDK